MWRNSYERRRGYGGGWSQRGRRPFRSGDYNREPPSWKSRQGGGRPAPAWKRAPKFTAGRTGNKRPLGRSAELQAKKRMKANHSQITLSSIILAKPGNNDGELPELVSSRFYDCNREARIGKSDYFLRINIGRKGGKKEFQDEEPNPEDRISIPVPLESIEGISVLSGMNPCEELLKAYSDRFALKASIDHWTRVIAKRTELHEENEQKLQELLQIEEEPEVESEVEEKDFGVEAEDENNPREGSEDHEEESEDEEKRRAREEEQNRIKEEKEMKAKAKLEAKKNRELALKKKNNLETVNRKLAVSLDQSKQNLANEEQKLEDLIANYGQLLAYFGEEVDEITAASYFKNGLTERLEHTADGPEAEKKEKTEMETEESRDDEVAPEVEEENGETEEAEKDADKKDAEKEDKTIAPGACHECGEAGAAKHKFCDKCGARQKPQETAEPEPEPKNADITDVPVWISILLNKPLEKFYASAVQNSICTKEVLEKVSLILLKYHPKHRSRIVLKNVTYKGAEEDLKDLNVVFKGPWKKILKKPSELLRGKTPYSLESILEYLAKTHQRQKVLDNMVENCPLCGAPIKRIFMDKHMTQYCQKREEPCEYCGELIVVENMAEHQENECPKFPVPCPLNCFSKQERCMLEEHRKICKNAIVHCEFWSFGCHLDLKRKQLTRHMKEAAVAHVKLLKARLDFLTGYLGQQDAALTDLLYKPPMIGEGDEQEMDLENEMNEDDGEEN